MTEIIETVTALKTIRDAVQAFLSKQSLSDAARTEVREIVRQLGNAQGTVVGLQEAHARLTKRVQDLEAENGELKQWKHEEKTKYQLHEYKSQGRVLSVVYKLRESAVSTDGPIHDICPNCYENHQRSILQAKDYAGDQAACPRCKATFLVVDSDPSDDEGRPLNDPRTPPRDLEDDGYSPFRTDF